MNFFLLLIFQLTIIPKIFGQKIYYHSDSVIHWTKIHNQLVNPEKPSLPFSTNSIRIDTVNNKISISNKMIDNYVIKKKYKYNQNQFIYKWKCIWEALDGNYNCLITITRKATNFNISECKIDFGKSVLIYYLK